MRVQSVYEGEETMRMRLPYKKVLLVLDNVDDEKQLKDLAGDWFKDGSRIIITTRDEKVLVSHGVNVNWIHDVSFLSEVEALILFSSFAFNRDIPDRGYELLTLAAGRYCAGLPLMIKVLGSHLRGENKRVWIDVLMRLETIPSRGTLDVLEISYNSLEDDHKEMFLDVACFLNRFPKAQAIEILDSCGFSATYGLKILEQKSLITISNEELGMHDRIAELGRYIVRRSHPHEPNKHSRLWIDEEIEELFSDDVDTDAPTCIGLQLLYLRKLSPEIIANRLGNLKKLRYLFLLGKLDDCTPTDWKFDQAKQYFPNSLQFMYWLIYPFQSLPQTFRANNLVGLRLTGSKIVQLWENGERKVLNKLRFLDLRQSKLRVLDLGMTPNLESLNLRGCQELTEIYGERKVLNNLRFLDLCHSKLRILDLGMTPNLESLKLTGCHELTEIHAPDGCLERLVYLNLIGCSWSVSFPLSRKLESLVLRSIPELCVFVEEFPTDSTNDLPMLKLLFQYHKEEPSSTEIVSKGLFLDLRPCIKLESVSGSICGLQHLRELTLQGCIPEVPNDLDQLTYLEKLNLVSTHVICLPDSVCMLKHLKSLTFLNCQHLEKLPENLGCLENLEELRLSSTSIRCLPDNICMLKHLKHLQLESCGFLEKLPEDIGQLECLEKLNLTECESLEYLPNSICNMKCLRYFYLRFCSRIQNFPEDSGNLKLLEELNIAFTGITHLPHSISSLNGLSILGSPSLLQSCAFATEIQTLDGGLNCHIIIVNSTPAPPELRTQSTKNYLKSQRRGWEKFIFCSKGD